MDERRVDYKKAKELVDELNHFIVNDKSLLQKFQYKEYDLLQALQQSFFSNALTYTSNPRNFSRKKEGLRSIKRAFDDLLITVLCKFLNTLTLISIKIWKGKPEILIFSVDKTSGSYGNDFRLNSIYEFLHKEQKTYVELFYAMTCRQVLKNLFRRKRLAFYQAGLSSFFSKNNISLTIVESGQNEFLKRIETTSRIYLSQFGNRVAQHRKLLKKISPRMVFTIDDVRHYHHLLVAAKEIGIPSYAFQHGHFTKYHIGWLEGPVKNGESIKADKLVIWNKYWEKVLGDLSSIYKEEDFLMGDPKFRESYPLRTRNKKDLDPIVVLIPFETDAPHDEVRSYIRKILDNEKYKLIFKVRPDLDIQRQKELYSLTDEKKVEVLLDIEKVEDTIDVALGVYSTYLYEMVLKGIPVGILETSMDYGYGMVESNLATLITVSNISSLGDVPNLQTSEVLDRAKKMLDGSTSISKLLMSII